MQTSQRLILGFIIVGGYSGSVHRSAEIYNPVTGHSCPAEDLPQTRQDAPMCNNMICGGYGSPDPERSCEMFDGASSFTRLPVSLVQRRDDHLCWGLQSGEVIIFGSYDSKRTTERVSADGLSSSADCTPCEPLTQFSAFRCNCIHHKYFPTLTTSYYVCHIGS